MAATTPPRRSPRQKLTPAHVQEIRQTVAEYRHRLGLLPDEKYFTSAWLRDEYHVERYRDIAARYGVAESRITEIIQGKAFPWIPQEEIVHA